MKRSKQIIATFLVAAVLAFTAPAANAGIIVGLADDTGSIEKCEVSESNQKGATTNSVGRGIIVGLTGIIVGLTGIIVGFADDETSCGHLPTGD